MPKMKNRKVAVALNKLLKSTVRLFLFDFIPKNIPTMFDNIANTKMIKSNIFISFYNLYP